MKSKSLLIAILLISFNVFSQIPGYVPLIGLQGYWPFTGNANDQFGNNHGVVTGAALTTDRYNVANRAYSFNGSSDFISTPYAGVLGTAPRAVAFWAKSSSTVQMVAVSWGDDAQSARYNCMFNYGTPGPTIDAAYGAITYSTSSSVSDNTWHHYVYQFNTAVLNAVEIYQDGVLLTTTTTVYNGTNTISTVGTNSVTFGKIYCCGNLFFDGSLDEIGIWDRTLTNCEIKQLYRSTYISSALTKSVMCQGETSTFMVSGATNYTWTPSVITGSSITVSPAVSSTYSVALANTLTGCSDTIFWAVKVNVCAGLNEGQTTKNYSAFPNPSAGVFNISGLNPGDTIRLLSWDGKLLVAVREEDAIDLSGFEQGLYFVEISSGQDKTLVKLVKN